MPPTRGCSRAAPPKPSACDDPSSRALILADVHVKHAQPLGQPDLAQAARDTAYRGLADALIVTGSATGKATEPGPGAHVKQAVPDRPVLIGSGVTAATVREALAVADGIIIGSDLRRAAGPAAARPETGQGLRQGGGIVRLNVLLLSSSHPSKTASGRLFCLSRPRLPRQAHPISL